MAITKGKLIADPAIDLDGDSVVSFLRDGSGNAITSTSGALDVNIDNASIAVTATDLDIRDLAFATDKVDVSGSSNVAVTDGGGSLTVDATDFDIRNLVFATDKVDVSGSSVSITGDVNVTQGTSPWVVSATDLDIRDLSSASDSVLAVTQTQFAEDSAHVSGALGQFMLGVRNDAGGSLVSADGDYAPLQVDASGALRISGSLSISGQYAEDAAHVSGDIGLYNLAVRADAPAVATSADGDYASQTVDAYNRSWVNSGANVSIANGAASVSTSALLVAAAAGRREIFVQNVGNKAIFLGASGVSTANGLKIPAGADLKLEIGPALALHAVAESGTQEVRYLQLA
jgi:hypothetical protein